MNNERKFSVKKVVKYIRDVSIVIAGVAVTLYVNYRVSNQGEKRDLKLYLNAIKIELEENVKETESVIEYYTASIEYSKYLQTHDKESIDRDSLQHYAKTCYTLQTFSIKTNAFEMFKTSGTMRLVDDKELMLSIWSTYDDLSSLKTINEWLFHAKWEDIKKDFPALTEKIVNAETSQSDFVPMYNFYIVDPNSSILQVCEEMLQNLKETIEKLEGTFK